jgi:hypothetical protein
LVLFELWYDWKRNELTRMTERTPIQISGDRVLCDDGTLWRWDNGDFMFGSPSGWVKLPPIPTDEQYEILKKDNAKKEVEWMERELKKFRN